MSFRIKKKPLFLFFFFLILTIAGSQFCTDRGYDKYLEYVGYGGLFIALALNRRRIYHRLKWKTKVLSLVVLILFSVGIVVNHTLLTRKIILLFTMIAIWMSVFWGEDYLCNPKYLRTISYAVTMGVIISIFLAIIGGYEMLIASEGIGNFKLGFTGGIKYKNYFAADMIVVFSGLFIYHRDVKRHLDDLVLMIIATVLLVLSGSRGGYVLFFVFLVAINSDKIVQISKQHRKIFWSILCIIVVAVFVILYQKIAMNSATYMYRIRGLLNYIDYYSHDFFHMLFGNSETVYDQELSYVYTIRTIVGWDGSLEFSWLDIIIKNGLLGIFGYCVIFLRTIFMAHKCRDWHMKSICVAFIAGLLISSLVEIYIQTIHAVYGIYGYLVLAGYRGIICYHEKNRI